MRPAPSPTAGPWRVIGRTIVGAPTVRSIAPFVAAVRRKADAPLIAAAPDMAALLARIVTIGPDDDPIVLFATVEQIRALLTRIGAQL